MSSLEKVIRSEHAGPSVVFRERAYGSVERQSLIRDILGLANALVDGPRYLILGVRDNGPDERSFAGLLAKEVAEAGELYPPEISRFIEPALAIDLQTLELDGALVAIVALNDCVEPPYLLKESVSNAMREGAGWILKSKVPARLRRADLQQLFKKNLFGPAHQPTLQVGFAGKGLVDEISLSVLNLDELPSKLAGEKFRKLMEVKQASHDIGGNTMTRIERLVHAREFGGTQPYEKISESSLVRRLRSAEEEHYWADDYYEYETRTHHVNIVLSNIGQVALCNSVLTLDFPHVEGFGVSEYVRAPQDCEEDRLEGYPAVDTGEKMIRVQAAVAAVPCRSTVAAFPEPLRVWIRGAVSGQTLPVDYRLHAAGLKEPLVGTLRIHVHAE